MNIRKTNIFLIAVLMMSQVIAGAGQETNENLAIQARRSEFKDIFSRLLPVNVYGKIIDQDGNPVADAEVKIGWESASFLVGKPDPGQAIWITSDASGLWEHKLIKPHRAYVEDVKKQGYEYSTRYNQESSSRNLVEKMTAKDAPVLTVLRKKGETTYLIHHEGVRPIRAYSPNSQTNSLDVLGMPMDKLNSGSYADVQISLDYSQSNSGWTITFTATNGTDGVIVDNTLYYEAPQKGYQKQIIINGASQPRYVYLRSRSPEIYSRLNLEYNIGKETETVQVFSIHYNVWINPYGSRNLEYENDLAGYWRLSDQLEEKAIADLHQKHHPTTPDLPRLIKEAKEMAFKDKSKQ